MQLFLSATREGGIFVFCPVLWVTEASLSNAFVTGTVLTNPTSLVKGWTKGIDDLKAEEISVVQFHLDYSRRQQQRSRKENPFTGSMDLWGPQRLATPP